MQPIKLNKKIQVSTFLLGLFFALTLFQTSSGGLGTIVSSVIIALIFVFILIETKLNFQIEKNKLSFFAFVLLLFCLDVFYGNNISRDLLKLVLLIILYIVATSRSFNKKEINLLINILIFSSIGYVLFLLSNGIASNESMSRITISILGSIIDPNFLGATFVLPAFFVLLRFLTGRKMIINGVMYGLLMVGIVVTGSRGALLSISVVSIITIIMLFYRKNTSKLYFKKIIFPIIFIVISYVAFHFISIYFGNNLARALDFESSDGGNGRVPIWIDRLRLFLNNPLWGYGTNLNNGIYSNLATHNTFIHILYISGFLGFILFIFPIISLFKKMNRKTFLVIPILMSALIPMFFLDAIDSRFFWNTLIIATIIINYYNKKNTTYQLSQLIKLRKAQNENT